MIDTWATVGSCAQIRAQRPSVSGAGIGGVLEPIQANPVIIEDNCFIGARAEVAEGVIVGEGSVLSMGVYIGQSTKIIDRATGFMHQGNVPPYSVVVSGTAARAVTGRPAGVLPLYCAVIVKTVDEPYRATRPQSTNCLETEPERQGARDEADGGDPRMAPAPRGSDQPDSLAAPRSASGFAGLMRPTVPQVERAAGWLRCQSSICLGADRSRVHHRGSGPSGIRPSTGRLPTRPFTTISNSPSPVKPFFALGGVLGSGMIAILLHAGH